ncbi:hypothetical protein ZIOFF_048679 [Zingiber officinale]|uniref:ubiquitinyl hydrolase 1 n=1 Tax=Zingiber officinale TaxID=94328 RepID=A0A8J5KUG3_ZINOF|nr:hypothetical protein ZIOFF_048679 [Zingiber officinale]
MPSLGFAVVALFLCPLLTLLARRKWRRAEARRAEVMRLALLAAEEAVQAEEEYLRVVLGRGGVIPAAEGGVAGPRGGVCAVCHIPTTMRCSRCKAVRYCTRKCQIIHWRQGHENSCGRPRIDDSFGAQVGITPLNGLTGDGSDLYNDYPYIEGNYQTLVMTSSKKLSTKSSYSSEAFSDDEFLDSSGTESASDSSDSSSSSYVVLSGPVKPLDDFSSVVCASVHHKSGSEIESSSNGSHDTLSSNVSHDKVRTEVERKVPLFEAKSAEYTPSNSKLTDSESCLNHSNITQSSALVNATDSTTFTEREHNILDANSHVTVSNELSDEAICSERKSRNEMLSLRSLSGVAQTVYTSSTTSINESGLSYGSKSHSAQLVKSKSLMSLSPAYVTQASPAGHFKTDYASRKEDNHPKAPVRFHHNVGSRSSDIKTSVQRVVQQLKLSKISKQHTSSFNNDSSKRLKMLFPFEYFVKLYNFDKVVLRPSGLINCHNCCYVNVVLQCLAFTTPLAAYLLEGVHSKSCMCPKRGWCFTCELENLLMNVEAGNSPLSPAGILSHIHKIGSHLGLGREEDAHEFLRYVIDAMESVCLKEAGLHSVDGWTEETTFIQLTFGGYLLSKIECLKCRNRSERFERMMDLTLDIEGNVGTLEEALRKFTMTEVLDGENRYHCPSCKSYERAKKKLAIVDAPNILTIALKRFQSGKFGKLNKAVRFPEYLDLAPYMRETTDKSLGYKLYSVVVHLDVMNAAFSGHYVCYVKNIQGKWFKTDDAVVKSMELEQVMSKNAYMLLYARCSPHCPSLTSKTLSLDQVLTKRSKSREACSSGYDTEETSYNPITTTPNQHHDEPNQMVDYGFSLKPCNSIDGMFHFPDRDSSSDSSSLFSCSDEASCSTESTRNSTSTEEFSDFIFGNLDQQARQSPSRFSDFSDSSGGSPLYSTHSYAAANQNVDSVAADRIWDDGREQCLDEGASSFLYSHTINHSKLTGRRSRETDVIIPTKLKSSVLRRSSTLWGRTSDSSYR